jgi:hypothetical protein
MRLVALKFFVAVADYSTGRNGSASRLRHLEIRAGDVRRFNVRSTASFRSAQYRLVFGFRPLGNFRLALLSSLNFMALGSMAASGTLTIVSERLK